MTEWMGTPELAMATALAPGLVGHALSRALSLHAVAARRVTAAAAAFAAAGAGLTAVAFAWGGPAARAWVSLPGLPGLGLGARVDGLSVLMLVTVTIIGAVVARYSIRYLDGDPEQARFSRSLSFTLSAVLVLIVSSNLFLLFLGWVAASHGLHRLLTHFGERPAALLAARAKFLISRAGDGLLLAALVWIASAYGTLELTEIQAFLAAGEAPSATPIALLLVLAAMTKSAQLPFHAWLPDSMETPTPVSALMHAGLINAGGFLLIRTSPLLIAAPEVLAFLAMVGAATGVLGAVSMLTQTDIKRKYAYSTVAQMGFMMLQCGLGAFGAAALHMVGHAFYKGYSFLSAGTAVDLDTIPVKAPRPSRVAIAAALAAGALVVAGIAWLLGVTDKPALPVLGSVLALAVAQGILVQASSSARLIAGAAGAVLVVTYFAGAAAMTGLLQGVVPAASPAVPWTLTLSVVGLFVAAFAAQHGLALNGSAIARAAWIHASNGFYIGAIQNRLVQRFWPLPR